VDAIYREGGASGIRVAELVVLPVAVRDQYGVISYVSWEIINHIREGFFLTFGQAINYLTYC
jgi:hypothetical protein